MVKPVFVFFPDGRLLLRLVDGVAEAIVNHNLHGDAVVLECLPQFKAIGERNSAIGAVVLKAT